MNEALVLRLAAEFQGFARDLHDLACDTFASWTAATRPVIESVVRTRLREARSLDRGNAHPGSLGSDFGRFGLDLWSTLAARDPSSTVHNRSLDRLNAARNAVAHDDEAALAVLRAEATR